MRRNLQFGILLALLATVGAHALPAEKTAPPKRPTNEARAIARAKSGTRSKPKAAPVGPTSHSAAKMVHRGSTQAGVSAQNAAQAETKKRAKRGAAMPDRAQASTSRCPASRKVAKADRRTAAKMDRRSAERKPRMQARAVSLHRSSVLAPPSPLRGSLESLERQNTKTEADGLERIEDDDDLNDRIARGQLVPVPSSAWLAVNSELPQKRRYCRPWTADFLAQLAGIFGAKFRSPLFVSSAVRTVAYQKQLMQTNGNAAQAEGEIASPHLTGATIDIAKSRLSRAQIAWVRKWLLPLQQAGKIDVEEEFRQACFHITVYKSYAPQLQSQPQKIVQPVGMDASGL